MAINSNRMSNEKTRLAYSTLATALLIGVVSLAGRPGWIVSAEEVTTAATLDFNRDIRSILADNCFFCHGPDEQRREADLRLDTREGLFGDLGGYAAVVGGKPEASVLLDRITSGDAEVRMPPAESGKQLDKQQIELIERWIQQGARWAEHWAYVAPQRPPLPDVAARQWPLNAIDHFILSRLEAERIAPSPEADRITLIRRLYFDLIGLPPRRAEVEAFVADPAADAYEIVVERLLKSPHYGERMAIPWLDLVRYADTVGYHGDQEHPISPYRDWVIKAWNDNLPFDQFTVEQLAGDLLPEATLWQKIASGYNRLLQTTHEGGAQDKEYLAKYAADRVRNVATVWLGATLGCAECHDHKYDPYTQADFYSLAAFFADLTEKGAYRSDKRPPEIPAWNLAQHAILQQLEQDLADLRQQAKSENDPSGLLADRIAALQQQKANVESQFRPTMVSLSRTPRIMRVLQRGDWMDESGQVVQPAVPHFLQQVKTEGRATRLDLARWLTSRHNPLTARVFVNRLWKMFFGKGISSRLDDLGAQGEAPVHPELLDWLAVEFVESGWDVKHLVKLMVTSRTYRQSSLDRPELRQRDPENRWLARQSRFRLEAELIRDNALVISGLLVPTLGGRSTRPYQPAGYYRHLNFPKRKYEHDRGENQYRRGVYTHWQRVFLHPMLKAFDAPSREECTAERPVSNTPLAALVLLNDPSFVEAARAFAVRIVREGGQSTQQRIRWAWREALSRPPSPREVAVLESLFRRDQQEYQTDQEAAARLLLVGAWTPPKDLDPMELAAWSSVARALLNLNETITRN